MQVQAAMQGDQLGDSRNATLFTCCHCRCPMDMDTKVAANRSVTFGKRDRTFVEVRT